MTPNDLLAAGYRSAKLLLHRMTDDLSPADFRRQPVSGANSAGWVVGHLAVVLRRTAERLGAADLPAFPDGLADKLAVTGKSAGEPADLGDPAELVRLFDAAIDNVIAALPGLSAEALAGPPAVKGPFATNTAEGLLFGSLHVAMHTGQLSTIRRSLGKPPVV